MATRITQFRYYNDNDVKNYPGNLEIVNENTQEKETLWPTTTMLSKYKNLKRVIIQTLPGTKITVYTSTVDVQGREYVIGNTGILDLDITALDLLISGLTIDNLSRNILYEVKNSYFIITVIYELEEDID